MHVATKLDKVKGFVNTYIVVFVNFNVNYVSKIKANTLSQTVAKWKVIDEQPFDKNGLMQWSLFEDFN